MHINNRSNLYHKIRAEIQQVIDGSGGVEALKISYRSRGETRLAWDLFWCTPSANETACSLYALGYNDDHVETALVRICRELELIIDPNWFEHHEHEPAAITESAVNHLRRSR